MLDQNILELQDYLLTLSKSETNGTYAYSFDEIEGYDRDPKLTITQYYEENYFQQDDEYYFALTEMLIDVDEVIGWENAVRNISEKYGLASRTEEIVGMLQHFMADGGQAWSVIAQKPSFVEDESDEELQADETRFTPIDTQWHDMLFRCGERFFLLHFGTTA
jgi:hypothetical protein